MTSPLHDRIEQAYADFERQKLALADIKREMSTAQTTITPKNRALTVTVDGRGDVVEIKFPTNSYRTMAPAELGNLLVETIQTAREQAREQSLNAFKSVLPANLPIMDMLNGSTSADDMIREAMRTFSGGNPSSTPGGAAANGH